MTNQRQRALLLAASAIILVWLVAWSGHTLARKSKMTAEKVRHYVYSVEIGELQGEERAKALRSLADKLNALPPDERRQLRLERPWAGWFQQMTEAEKESFIEATFPVGIKQMLTAFEQMPDAKRKNIIDEAIKRLREADELAIGDREEAPAASQLNTNPPPVLSKELEVKIRTVGLKTFFSESSAQTKAEVAPLLEEIQRILNRGRRLRDRQR